MRKHVWKALLVAVALSATASATMVHQDWLNQSLVGRDAIINFLGDLVNPVPAPDTETIIEESRFEDAAGKSDYVAKFYGWVTVPATGTYQFHYACDDNGMLYVSQDEEMANAVQVAYVDGWCSAGEWNKYPDTQHSEPMNLTEGQVMAVMAFFEEQGGGDNMDIGWTGPTLSSDITNPTYLTDYITHIAPSPTKAKNPKPENGATDLPRDTALSWVPGKFAATHNVYLGTNSDDVNAADVGSPLLVGQQDANAYDPPGLLDYGQTYYWRVDEVNAPPTSSTVFKGKIWSFTVEPLYYEVTDINATASIPTSEGSGGPEATVNGSGLTDGKHGVSDSTMWAGVGVEGEPSWLQYDFDRVYKLYGIHVWNYNGLYEPYLGFGLKDVTIEYAVEPNEWMALGDFALGRGTGKNTYAGQTIDLDGLAARSIRVVINSTQFGGSQPGLAEIQFLYKPVFAREPKPADGETAVDRDSALSWRSGREAASHQVYLGTDSNAVAEGAGLIGTATTNTIDPGPLDLGATYFWKVVEVNDAEEPTAWDSALWSFTAQEYVTIDGFETYTEEEGSLVFEAWIDGYGVTSNGSQVGHNDPPYVETAIRHSGAKSMPFSYGNTGGATMSEAELTLTPSANWTGYGIQSLSLSFAGTPDSDGQLYLKVNGVKIPYDGPASDLASTVWHAWNVDLSTVGTNLSAVSKVAIGVDGAGASGLLYIDDVRLYPKTPEYIIPTPPANTGLVAHYTFDAGSGMTVADASGNGNTGTAEGSPGWVPGKINGAMEFSGDDYVDCGDAASLVIRDAITVACWIKVQAFVNNWETIIAMGDDSYRMSRGPETGNSIHFGCNGPTGGNLDGVGDVTTNTWRHATLVYDGVDKIIYIDGIEVARVASTGQIDESSYNLWIGANEQQTGRNFHGLIDDLRIYNRPLSPEEVAGLAGLTEPVAKPF